MAPFIQLYVPYHNLNIYVFIYSFFILFLLIDWLIHSLINWLIDWLIDSFIHWFIDSLIHWFTLCHKCHCIEPRIFLYASVLLHWRVKHLFMSEIHRDVVLLGSLYITHWWPAVVYLFHGQYSVSNHTNNLLWWCYSNSDVHCIYKSVEKTGDCMLSLFQFQMVLFSPAVSATSALMKANGQIIALLHLSTTPPPFLSPHALLSPHIWSFLNLPVTPYTAENNTDSLVISHIFPPSITRICFVQRDQIDLGRVKIVCIYGFKN